MKCLWKQNCSPLWYLSNNMWHATWMQINWGDSWLLVVGSQIDNLTFGLSFGHNLCFKYPNGSWEPILDIYVSRAFQWYKELFNPMNFNPCNWPLKIQMDSHSQSGSSLGSVGVHSFTFSCTLKIMKCDSWASFLACAFASLCFGREPKAKVTTLLHWIQVLPC
jgi:hypothetical protein